MSITFDTQFEPLHGEAVATDAEAPITRLTAPNAGPFTFHGTNTYLIGTRELVVIDPGPDDERHFAALMAAIADRPVSAIAVTHTHADHSPLARRLKQQTGAEIVGCAPHFGARPLADGEVNLLDASADRAHAPDRILDDGHAIDTECGPLAAVATPGHTANHLCFALDQAGVLFSGDHVMAWSTSIVAPPDGAMGAYMASLDRLIARDDRIYLPGHGGPVRTPGRFVRAIRSHRRMRSRAIVERIAKGDHTIAEIVAAIYAGIDPCLHGAGALSVFAHLEELVETGAVRCASAMPGLDAQYAPA